MPSRKCPHGKLAPKTKSPPLVSGGLELATQTGSSQTAPPIQKFARTASASEHLRRLSADDVAVLGRVTSLFCWNVLPRDVGRVWFAVRREALGDTNARTIELADDPFLLSDWDGGPPQGDRFVWELEGLHQTGAVLFDHLLAKSFEVNIDNLLLMRARFNLSWSFIRGTAVKIAVSTFFLLDVCRELASRKFRVTYDSIVVEEVLGASATDGGHATWSRHLVDDAKADGVDHVEAKLTLKDTASEALIGQLTTRGLATLEVLARTLALPLTRLCFVIATSEAPCNELTDCVMLHMVVVSLHQDQLFTIFTHGIPIGRT